LFFKLLEMLMKFWLYSPKFELITENFEN